LIEPFALRRHARDTPAEARERLPLLNVDDLAHAGFEPDAGYADAHLTLSAFVKSARRRGVQVREGVTVTDLLRAPDGRVVGVRTDRGDIHAGRTIVALNIWTGLVERWTGIALPLTMSRHAVFTLEGATPYTRDLPVLKDLASPAKLYMRSYATRQLSSATATRANARRAGHRAGRRAARSRRRARRGRAPVACVRRRRSRAPWTGVTT
jgi:glycine/D-amino acid oxidase-like deaminating enzyme